MALNLSDTVIGYLKSNTDKKFTAKEIAGWVFSNHTDECRKKRERSKAMLNPLDSDEALIQQLSAEIGAQRPKIQKKYPQIKTTEGRPRKYYYTNISDVDEVIEAETTDESATDILSTKLSEHDLYPILSKFLSELSVSSRRIDEKKSSNLQGRNGNKWLYPDLVGVENLSNDWTQEIKDCVQQYFDKKTKLWSFEVKKLINRSNVRESYFQAVSNSSWANFGYLVANEIEHPDTLKEIRILSGVHGIGLIELNIEDPTESQIIIPAKERTEIDWHTANRLSKENKDFSAFIKAIRQFYQTGDFRKSDFEICE